MGESGLDVAVSIDNPDAGSAVTINNPDAGSAVTIDNPAAGSAVTINNPDTGSAVTIDNPDTTSAVLEVAATLTMTAAAAATVLDGTTTFKVVFSDDAMDVDAGEHPSLARAVPPPAGTVPSDELELPSVDTDGADDGGLVLDLS